MQLGQLQADLAKFRALGAEVWTITVDAADKLEEMRQEKGLEFPLLIDPGSATIKRYGILNPEDGKIPHPTAVVVDRQGIVRYLRVDEDYRQRPANEELLAALEGL